VNSISNHQLKDLTSSSLAGFAKSRLWRFASVEMGESFFVKRDGR
jgi:hypothetical protein